MSFFAFLCHPAAASPWLQNAGDGLTISRIDYFRSRFDDGAFVPANNVFERFESVTYGEYGLSDRILLNAEFAYGLTRQSSADSPVLNEQGITRVEIGAQYKLAETRRGVTSARIAYILPPSAGSGVREGFAASGQDLDVSLLYGRTLSAGKVPVFASAIAGYRRRFGDSADQVRLQSTLGAQPGGRWLLLGEVFSEFSLGNNAPGGADFDIIKVQPSVVFHVKPRWSVQIGVTQDVSGRNIELGRSIFLGLWRRF